jgi:hypothetical protein
VTARPFTGFSLEATIKDVTRAYLQITGISIPEWLKDAENCIDLISGDHQDVRGWNSQDSISTLFVGPFAYHCPPWSEEEIANFRKAYNEGLENGRRWVEEQLGKNS